MRFAHMADVHIGSWRDPKLREISTKAFIKAADICIEKGVEFIVIAGDLLNTPLPPIEALKSVVLKLRELKGKNIPVYMIAGSHDFSPSGKTMLDVIENAGLVTNVAAGKVEEEKLRLRFTSDEKTGARITGLLGKKGALEKSYYEMLDRKSLEQEPGFKIFLFHTALSEFKPKEMEKMESSPLSLLPKGFDYYAGGHPHFVFHAESDGYGTIAYPGPLFPNNFAELEKLSRGGFYIIEDRKVEWEPVQVYNHHPIILDCSNKTPEAATAMAESAIKNMEFVDTIVTLRLHGTLGAGKPSDIDFREIFSKIYGKGAYFVMKNTSKLVSKEFEAVKIETASVDDIEDSLINEHTGQIKTGLSPEKEKILTKELMKALSIDKGEGEKVFDFENRVRPSADRVMGSFQ